MSNKERAVISVPQECLNRGGTNFLQIQNLKLGDTVSILGIVWRVVHYVDDDNKIYLTLCSEHVLGNVPYTILKWKDTELKFCRAYCIELCHDLVRQFLRLLDYHRNVLNGLTFTSHDKSDKCHLLTKAQLEGEYEWFNSVKRRVATDLNGDPAPYWTGTRSTSSSYVWSVNTDGSFNGYSYAGLTNGFRPCIHLSFNMYCQ